MTGITHSFLEIAQSLLEIQDLRKSPSLLSNLQGITQKCISLAQGIHSNNRQTLEEAGGIIRPNSRSAERPAETIEKDTRLHPSASREKLPSKSVSRNVTGDTTRWLTAVQSPSLSTFWSSSEHQIYSENSFHPLPTVSPFSSGKSVDRTQWDFARHLTRHCCFVAYKLVTNPSCSTHRIQEVFGVVPPPSQRQQLAESLYSAVYYENGKEIERRTNVLTSFDDERTTYLERYQGLANSNLNTDILLELLDACDVQNLLEEKLIQRSRGQRLSLNEAISSLECAKNLDVDALIKG